jgi:glutamine synthetase
MKLGDFLKQAGISISQFAERARVSEAAMSRYIAGKRLPRPEILRRIIAATGGRVSANDLYEDMAAAPEDGGAGATQAGVDRPIEALDVLITDTNGQLRGKRLPGAAVGDVMRDGIRLPESIFALDVNGENIPATGLVWESGDADRPARPADGRIIPVPWADRPTVQMLLTMQGDDGQPFFADPRNVLARVAARFKELEVTPVVAVELEFYLLDQKLDAAGRPQAPIGPVSGRRATHTQVYAASKLDEFTRVLDAIHDACAAQGVPADGAVAEYAPGQFEINLEHVADPLLAADHAILFKRAVKAVAQAHGFQATFMAKPFAELAGSGLHMHMSLVDKDGRNLGDGGAAVVAPLLRHAIGGLCATMAEGMLIFAPTANSYRRFRAGSYAPLAPSWGVNNRTVALRVPGGSGDARRVEHRLSGADANVYLALAAVLAGAHHGIVNKIEPPAATTGNAYDSVKPSLPRTAPDALAAFDGAAILPEYFGQPYWRLYGAHRRAELEKFAQHVSDLDYAWYLGAV